MGNWAPGSQTAGSRLGHHLQSVALSRCPVRSSCGTWSRGCLISICGRRDPVLVSVMFLPEKNFFFKSTLRCMFLDSYPTFLGIPSLLLRTHWPSWAVPRARFQGCLSVRPEQCWILGCDYVFYRLFVITLAGRQPIPPAARGQLLLRWVAGRTPWLLPQVLLCTRSF